MEHGGSSARPGLGLAIRRALMGRCPNCGQVKLLASYLKPVARCAICGEAYGHIRSDDAAPWLTILAVGIFGVPAILAVESHTTWPTWASSVVWPLFGRSEEHTSELQSLMRISYAVFCFKKKKKHNTHNKQN